MEQWTYCSFSRVPPEQALVSMLGSSKPICYSKCHGRNSKSKCQRNPLKAQCFGQCIFLALFQEELHVMAKCDGQLWAYKQQPVRDLQSVTKALPVGWAVERKISLETMSCLSATKERDSTKQPSHNMLQQQILKINNFYLSKSLAHLSIKSTMEQRFTTAWVFRNASEPWEGYKVTFSIIKEHFHW